MLHMKKRETAAQRIPFFFLRKFKVLWYCRSNEKLHSSLIVVPTDSHCGLQELTLRKRPSLAPGGTGLAVLLPF